MSEQPRNNPCEEIVLGPAQMANLPSSREVSILYRNWKGEVAWRRIVPLSIRFESSQWHPVPQWVMRALDIDREAERSFAIADIQNWKPSSARSPSSSSNPSPRSG
jgi:predicted DNA-binding transcriptional regulator YafY